MANEHYLHYWTPSRAQRAFGAAAGPIRSLDHGQFKGLRRGHVVWICTKSGGTLQIVLRLEVARDAWLVPKPPPYAVGYSRTFSNRRATFKPTSDREPHLVPVSLRIVKRLGYLPNSSRAEGELNQILIGPLASRRRIQDDKISLLESLWSKRANHPWHDLEGDGLPPQTAVDISEPPKRLRVDSVISRIVRDSTKVKRLKRLHGHRCQLCGKALRVGDGGKYSEGHHLQPLGRDHDGPDVAENILVVCPNHHAQLDLLGIEIDAKALRTHPDHAIAESYVRYHNQLVRRSRRSVT